MSKRTRSGTTQRAGGAPARQGNRPAEDKTPRKVFLGSQEGLNHGTRFGTAAGCWSGHWDWNQDDSFRSLTKLSNYAFLGGKKEKNGMFDSVSAEHSTIAVFNKYSGGS